VRERADRWYHQQLAPAFLSRWLPDDLDELMAYLGDAYDERRLHHHVREVEVEEEAAPNETTFYRTSEAYLYDLTVFALSGTKDPYRRLIRRLVPPGSRLLDYGCGIGSDGLRLIDDGYRVEFADFANPSTRYLAWRLARRGLHAPIHDIEQDVPTGFDLAYCFDVLEHVEDPYAVLQRLESLASIVVVNLLEPEPGDTHVHKPLDVPHLLDYAASRGLRHYRKWYGRSHLIAYVSHREGTINSARSFAWRRVGDHARMASLFERTERVLANAVHRSVSVTRGG
jgi:SAM-dependent methyltransferase